MNAKLQIRGNIFWGLVTGALLASVSVVEAQTFTLNDIGGHGTATDCWSAVYGDVYDVTNYIPMHPDGPNSIVNGMCGKDGTLAFDAVHGGTPGYLMFPGVTRLGTLAAAATAAAAAPPPAAPASPNNNNNNAASDSDSEDSGDDRKLFLRG